MVKAVLAGYNVEKDTIDAMKRELVEWRNSAAMGQVPNPELINVVDLESITPEIISAAYARISRDPRSVTELRSIARSEVESARRSNRNIVFDISHQSVAEHAVFNFDVLDISRLAIEFVEKHRIGGYTEKSQRYITLKGDYFLPSEISAMGLEGKVRGLVDRQNRMYQEAFPAILPFMNEEFKADKGRYPETITEKRTVEGFAKEDARYIVSIMTLGQLGWTLNARELEYVIMEGQFHPCSEVRELTAQLHDQVKEIAPSLIMLADPVEFQKSYGTSVDTRFMESWSRRLAEANSMIGSKSSREKNEEVVLTQHDASGEQKIIDALLKGESGDLDPEKKKEYMRKLFVDLGKHDRLPREFELADAEFAIIMSSSCYAQMKRHRMMTLLPFDYDPGLGLTIPKSVSAVGFEPKFRALLDEGSELFYDINTRNPAVAPYVLSNAHRRPVILKCDLRELYAISRLREDKHAQWDIRNVVHEMVLLAKEVYPVITMYMGGKDSFDEVKNRG